MHHIAACIVHCESPYHGPGASEGELGLIYHCILYGGIHGPIKIHEHHIQDMCDMDPTDMVLD